MHDASWDLYVGMRAGQRLRARISTHAYSLVSARAGGMVFVSATEWKIRMRYVLHGPPLDDDLL